MEDGTQLERIGASQSVPEGPGLGVGLDRGELERLESLRVPRPDRWIVKSRFDNGSRMYNIADPDESIFMVRPDKRKLLPFSYDAPLSSQWWDDDGTKKYREMFARIQKRGVVLEKPEAKD